MSHSSNAFWMLAVAGMVSGACAQRTDGAGAEGTNEGRSPQTADPAGAVFCAGVNSCKGTSDCKTPKHDCAGKNECKGQGVLRTSTAECAEKGGTVQPNMM